MIKFDKAFLWGVEGIINIKMASYWELKLF